SATRSAASCWTSTASRRTARSTARIWTKPGTPLSRLRSSRAYVRCSAERSQNQADSLPVCPYRESTPFWRAREWRRLVHMRMPFKWVSAGALALVVALITAWSATAASSFTVTPLVSDNGVPGTLTDTDLVNSSGLTSSPTSPFWVADNGTGVSTVYRIQVPILKPLTVSVGDAPTGTV